MVFQEQNQEESININQKNISASIETLYELISIHKFKLSEYDFLKKGKTYCYTLVYCIKGTGHFTIEKAKYMLKPNEFIIIPPSKIMKLMTKESVNRHPTFEFYKIHFNCLQLLPMQMNGELHQRKKTYIQVDNVFKCMKKSCKHFASYIINKLDILLNLGQTPSNQWNKMQQYGIFFQLLWILLHPDEEKKDGKGSKSDMKEITDYILTHYKEAITRETLAGLAGLSPSHFSHVFKRRTGKSPIEYLTEIRIRRAKELLVTSNKRLKEIAENVGYRDEFYFSRMFKKNIGLSPRNFMKKRKRKVFNFENTFNGHFSALNNPPFATVIWHYTSGYQLMVENQMCGNIKLNDMEVLIKQFSLNPPDLIVSSDINIEFKEKLCQIAPVSLIKWENLTWRQHFMEIAKIYIMEEEAAIWLKKYDLKAAQAAEKLQSHFKQNETVMILRIYDNHFALYGNRNIGGVLYDDLRLNPIGGREYIASFQQKSIDLHEIIDGQPDHLFILRAQDPSSKNLYHKLVKHRGWQQLPAVLKNQVYYIKIYPWLEYSAKAHNMIIDEITQLFSNKN